MATRATLFSVLATVTAAANITTSYFLPNASYATAHIRFFASVINASDDGVTLAARIANSPQFPTTDSHGSATLTLASTLYESSTKDIFALQEYSQSDTSTDNAYSIKCEKTASSATADCTASWGRDLALQSCRTGRYNTEVPTRYLTRLWTYSDTETKGVDTLVQTIPGAVSTPMPAWCSDGGGISDVSDISVPESARSHTFTEPENAFAMYQFVITAGVEKLPTATTGGSGSTGSSGSEGNAGSGTGSPGIAPMKTVAPALAGLGAAVAVFL